MSDPHRARPLPRALVILLALGTAITHFTLAFPDPVFILNGLGYLGLVSALYVPVPALAPYRRTIRRLLIGYTALTILLWLAFGQRFLVGYVNKLNELALIAALLVEQRFASNSINQTGQDPAA